MSTQTPTKPAPEPDPTPAGPPEEEFWERYNKRLEFPLSTVSAVLIHVLVAAALIFILVRLMDRETDKNLPLKLVDVGGLDDAGDGSAGSGGVNDPLAIANSDPFKAISEVLPDPSQLPQVKENVRKLLEFDGNLPISDVNAAAYSTLDEALRKKMLGVGAQKGDGPGTGKGYDGTKGSGPGGTGADSSRARSLRWVLRFRTTDGRDYLNQLSAMGAEILVPVPPDNSKCLIVTDIRNPKPRMATDADFTRLAGQIKFSDTRRDSVKGVTEVLGVDFTPKSFWAFFPKGLEDELDRKERAYRNRRPEDIEETIFRVTVRGGSYEVIVDDQTAKR